MHVIKHNHNHIWNHVRMGVMETSKSVTEKSWNSVFRFLWEPWESKFKHWLFSWISRTEPTVCKESDYCVCLIACTLYTGCHVPVKYVYLLLQVSHHQGHQPAIPHHSTGQRSRSPEDGGQGCSQVKFQAPPCWPRKSRYGSVGDKGSSKRWLDLWAWSVNIVQMLCS